MDAVEDLRTGCCGFPLSLAKYARTFPVVEVQQTFYQPPMRKTLERWKARVPEGFEFTLKAWQLITHEPSSPTYRRLREKLSDRQRREAGAFRLSDTVVMAWQRTLECAGALGSRTILFQCPARFTPTKENKSSLRRFFREVRKAPSRGGRGRKLTLVWEPRGEWKAEEVSELCEELSLVHAVDPFQCEPVTARLFYFRLHGKTGYRYRYTDDDLRWLVTMTASPTSGYVLFNNISMLEDAQRFLRLAIAT